MKLLDIENIITFEDPLKIEFVKDVFLESNIDCYFHLVEPAKHEHH